MAKTIKSIMVRVSESDLARIHAVSSLTGIKPAPLGRMALLELVARHESKDEAMPPQLAANLAHAKQRGLDLATIDAAQLDEITEYVGICRIAKEQGIDPRAELTFSVAARMEARALQPTGT